MAKSPDAFRTISEVATQLDTPAHVLRFWESKFPQVKPVKRAGGRRYYRPDDIALLGGIKILLHDQGMTIRGVQKLLRERGSRYVATLSALPWEGVESPEEPGDERSEDEALPEAEAVPEPVVVGPWPGAGEHGPDERVLPPEADDAPAPLPESATMVEAFVSDVAVRLTAPPEPTGPRAPPTIARLREALSGANRERLRGEAARLQPLVDRLRHLRGEGSRRTA